MSAMRAVIFVCAAALGIGWAGASVAVQAEEEGADQSKTLYFRQLLRKPQATIEDAFHATARYKGYNQPTNLAAEIEFLAQQGVRFPPEIRKILNDPLDKGSAVHVLMKALGVKGGIMYRLFPENQRYALREAVDLGFLPADSVVSEKLSGADLLGILVKVVDYTRKRGKVEEEE